MYGRHQYELDKNLYKREKNWNQRFVLDKIPKFDAYNDVNYLMFYISQFYYHLL